MYTITDVVQYVRAEGISRLFRAVLRRYVYRNEKETIVRRSLEGSIPRRESHHTIDIRRASVTDVPGMHKLAVESEWWRSRNQLMEWVEKGYPFFVAIADGRIVGYSCISLELVRRDPTFNRLTARAVGFVRGDGWGADALVVPRVRGKGVYGALGAETLRCAWDMGCRRVIGTVSTDNGSAVDAHQSIGFESVGQLTVQRLFFYKRVTRSTLKRSDIDGQHS